MKHIVNQKKLVKNKKRYIGENQVNNSIISLVDKTLIEYCFLKSGSLDQIGQFSFNANANIGISLSCGASFFASDLNSLHDSIGINLMNPNRLDKRGSNCSEFIFAYFNTSCFFLFNSSMFLSEVYKKRPNNVDLDINSLTGFGLKKDRKMFVSTANFIYQPSFFNLSQTTCLISLPSRKASSSNSLSESSCFNICSFQTNILTLDSIYFLISADQFTSGNLSIFFLISSGNDSVKIGRAH